VPAGNQNQNHVLPFSLFWLSQKLVLNYLNPYGKILNFTMFI
jgi:hypothetical protein